MTAVETVKQKTTAKKRYLRRKKERRKNRKPSIPKPAGARTEIDEDGGDETKKDAVSDTHNKINEMQPAAHSEPDHHEEVSEHSPSGKDISLENQARKQRKLQPEETDESKEFVNDPLGESPLDAHITGTSTSQSTLPRFPLPAMPDAPSKSVLALQGLDKALVEAEIVDPQTVLPITLNLEDNNPSGLSMKTRSRLKDLGITELFAVQTALLPFLLPPSRLQRSLYLPYDPPRDVCVSAPTGSGKTLAYVLPIIEILSARTVTRLRALVVLPTRDLVTQVRETFEAVGKGRGLKIASATGQNSFAHEQSQLVADKLSPLKGGSSKVDVLICTPGRLIDHLNGTPNFSLQHLRFLIIDEADRLLAQSFQDWLAQVLAAIHPPAKAPSLSESQVNPTRDFTDSIPIADALAPTFSPFCHAKVLHTDVDENKAISCQKLLFSATLTSDPGMLAALDLRDPKYIAVQMSGEHDTTDVAMETFTMPVTLTEHMVVSEASRKPLVLFYLVHKHSVKDALVFTKSSESTARLVRLFDFFESARAADGHNESDEQSVVVRAYSSDLPASERRSILEQFKSQAIHILVCSDVISRGIDISHVSHVVSYDVPVDMRKYVHRVGRTARAGRMGTAWTLVEEQEARYFKSMLRGAGHAERVKRMRVREEDIAIFAADYEAALLRLKEVYTR